MENNIAQTCKLTYPTLTPYLIVKGAIQLIEFLKQAFDAQVLLYEMQPEGRVKHAELQLGDSKLMLSEATTDYLAMPGMFFLFLDEVDSYYQKALKAGAISIQEPQNKEYGHRDGGVKDFAGNQWWIASEIKK